jgi:anti-sigma factor RsiW
MQHVSTENLLTYLDGKATDAEKSALEAHLAVCTECSESRKEIQGLEHRLRMEPKFEPPAHMVQAWFDLFSVPRHSSPEPKKISLRRIIASLVFDSFAQPLLAEERGVAAAPRPSLYRAGDTGVDVKIEITETDEGITLSGQVLSGTSKFLDNFPVGLESGGIIRYQTRTNATGEFSFEVPKDTYHLSIEMPQGQVTILDVHPRNPGKR